MDDPILKGRRKGEREGGKQEGGGEQEGIEEEMERGRKGAVTYRISVICWSIYICYRETKKVKTFVVLILVAHNIKVHAHIA